MLRLPIIVAFVFVIVQYWTLSQEKTEIVQQRLEFIAEQVGNEEVDLTNLMEYLSYCLNNPININTSEYSELEELSLLSEIQINELILHRRMFGKYISIYELQSLAYWDLPTIKLVLPFIRVDDRIENLHVSWKEALRKGGYEIFLRYKTVPEKKLGYLPVSASTASSDNSHYNGNPDNYYFRFRYNYRTNLSVGITGEKDHGEQFFKGSQSNGFDFYSFHAYYKGGKYLKAIALGDYQIQLGQGLNLWTGFSFSKSADVTNNKKNGNSIRPYTSVDETRFLRGSAVEFGLGPISWTTFASIKKIDASVVLDSTISESEYFSSFNLTGLHRTASEIDRKNALREKIAGSNLRFRNRNVQVGLSGVYQGYNLEYNKPIQPYNQFDFRGKEMFSFSGDYSWVVRNFNFFGESSYSTFNANWANVHGVLISMDARASFSLLYRNYQRGYQSFYNAGFSENGNTQNESGFYGGIKLKVNQDWTLNSYVDLFKFPWLKYQTHGPSEGQEIFIQTTYKPTKHLEIYGRYREKVKQKNSRNSDGTVLELEDVNQRIYRINLSYTISETIQLKSRIEYISVKRISNNSEKGVLVSQDILVKPTKIPIDLSIRYALFDTDSYDSRIYSFENNALYVFTVPSYYYQGSRAYILVRYSFLKRFDLWVKYGNFIYNNRERIGTGSEEIKGSKKSDITIQLRVKL